MFTRQAVSKVIMRDNVNQSGAKLVKIPDILKNTLWQANLKYFTEDSLIKVTKDRFIINFMSRSTIDPNIGYVNLDSADAVGNIDELDLDYVGYKADFSTNKNKDLLVMFELNDDFSGGTLILRNSSTITLRIAFTKTT